MSAGAGRPAFPTVIDSSLLSDFRACPERARLKYLEHWKPKGTSVHLHAGKAYAEGLEAARLAYYVDGVAEADAEAIGLAALLQAYGTYECPPESPKSLERMCGALEFYFEQYPMSQDKASPVRLPGGRQGVEFSFAEPMDVLHPETGQPLIYVGRMDMMCDFLGQTFGEDDKTTSSLGPSWSRQWDLRSQFTAYCWGARQAGYPLAGFIVRGVSILRTKYDTQQVITYRPNWMIDRWYEQTQHDLRRMIQMWEEGRFDMALDGACNEYGGCDFKQVCLAQSPEPWLRGSYHRLVWDPVTRTETELAEEA